MKKLVCVSCTILVVIVLPCILLYHYGSHNYLDKFFSEQMIPLMGTIMALNFAIATSLQAMLYNIEQANKDVTFKKTRNEIVENLIFMIILFTTVFIIQVCTVPMRRLYAYGFICIKLLLFHKYFKFKLLVILFKECEILLCQLWDKSFFLKARYSPIFCFEEFLAFYIKNLVVIALYPHLKFVPFLM